MEYSLLVKLQSHLKNTLKSPAECSNTLYETKMFLVGNCGMNDIDKEIAFLEKNHGFCDCEVLMNIEVENFKPKYK